VLGKTDDIFLAQVGGVDYGVFRYRYELVGKAIAYEACRLASANDIAAMKMTAIVQCTTKRDHVDLHDHSRAER
jgi:hypothetical protein